MPYFVLNEAELFSQAGVKKPGMFGSKSDARKHALNWMEGHDWELLQVTTIHSGETAQHDYYFKRPAGFVPPEQTEQ